MAAGEGAWLSDCDGNRYLDMLNNFTSLAHGHAQPDIVEHAADQLMRGTVFGAAAEPQVALAQQLIDRVPSIEMLRFTNSGTEATMMMMRAARAFTGRDIIVKIDGGYHVSHDFVEVSVSADAASERSAVSAAGGARRAASGVERCYGGAIQRFGGDGRQASAASQADRRHHRRADAEFRWHGAAGAGLSGWFAPAGGPVRTCCCFSMKL